ncbi:Uu.00g087770.m01.CDS01 [Anthostomella pinea]|uniref:Uu.00g087770.m01.CDS01 n=1 Tax=Anthostomella pinea TaxID=933095 RepID=A0AAI8YJW8_9PEZI|nr:Uu.00g087770.m01.CDS01 [Anthostomella pinea]
MAGCQKQILGQVLALNTLLQGMQIKLAQAVSSNQCPQSLFNYSRSAASIFGAADSVLGAEEFAFDDAIVNSRAYRRAMALAQAQMSGSMSADQDEQPTVTKDAESDAFQALVSHSEDSRDPAESSARQMWRAPMVYRSFVSEKPGLNEQLPAIRDDWATAFQLPKASLKGTRRRS